MFDFDFTFFFDSCDVDDVVVRATGHAGSFDYSCGGYIKAGDEADEIYDFRLGGSEFFMAVFDC